VEEFEARIVIRSNFFDSDGSLLDLLPEVEQLLKKITGAARALAFERCVSTTARRPAPFESSFARIQGSEEPWALVCPAFFSRKSVLGGQSTVPARFLRARTVQR